MTEEETAAAEPPYFRPTGVGIPVLLSVNADGDPKQHLTFVDQEIAEGETRSGVPFSLRIALPAGLLIVNVGARQYCIFARDFAAAVVDIEEKRMPSEGAEQ